VVERNIAWLNRNRSLAKDVEATIESSVTWLYIARCKLTSRRLAAVWAQTNETASWYAKQTYQERFVAQAIAS